MERRAASFRLFGNQFRCFRLHPWSLGALVPASLHFKHQTLEVFGLRQIEDDRMVESGAAALEEAHAARGIGGGRGHGGFEIGPAHVMRAGAGDEQTAGTRAF